MTDSMRVSLPAFEGPLDLLLYLVKKDEVDIYDIQIKRITEQYLQYLSQMEALNLEIAGDFLVMAANLIYLKSRTLLPVQEQPPEEDAEEDDPRWDLIRQLIEYKKFKEAASDLQNREDLQMNIYNRQELPMMDVERGPDLGKVGMLDLIRAFQRVLTKLESKQRINEIYEEEFTVAQKIEYLLDSLQLEKPALFTSLFEGLASRSEIVVTFLALLELVRLKQLKVRQAEHSEDIEIERLL